MIRKCVTAEVCVHRSSSSSYYGRSSCTHGGVARRRRRFTDRLGRKPDEAASGLFQRCAAAVRSRSRESCCLSVGSGTGNSDGEACDADHRCRYWFDARPPMSSYLRTVYLLTVAGHMNECLISRDRRFLVHLLQCYSELRCLSARSPDAEWRRSASSCHWSCHCSFVDDLHHKFTISALCFAVSNLCAQNLCTSVLTDDRSAEGDQRRWTDDISDCTSRLVGVCGG